MNGHTEANGTSQVDKTDDNRIETAQKTGPKQSGQRTFDRPMPPKFTDKNEELKYKLDKLAAAYRIFARLGYDDHVAGHLTLRDPLGRGFWVTPFGKTFSLMTTEDLLLIDEEGHVIAGGRENKSYNAAGFAIHHAIHTARPDVEAACHSHSTYGKAYSVFGTLPEIITQDACSFYNDLALYNQFGGVVLDDKEGNDIAAALGQKKAVILQNHGILTVGGCIESAVAWFVALERMCQVQLLVDAASAGTGKRPVPIGQEEAAFTNKQTGGDAAGWFSAQPLFEQDAFFQKEGLRGQH